MECIESEQFLIVADGYCFDTAHAFISSTCKNIVDIDMLKVRTSNSALLQILVLQI